MHIDLSVFSQNYKQARSQFLEATQSARLSVDSYAHPSTGAAGELLFMDVVLHGDPASKSLLILSSACHGVEGFCGSGAQIAALRDPEWMAAVRDSGVAVLTIHALNPHGFSHLRRVTNEGVDLNRNFHSFKEPLPNNDPYQQLHHLLLPKQWPPTQTVVQSLQDFHAAHPAGAFQSAVTRGQYTHPDGLFFGGTSPTWSNQTLRQVLRKYGQRCEQLAWIDYHTGLGPRGFAERIFAGPDDAAAFARAKSWWGSDGATPITSVYDGSSTSAFLTGLMWTAAVEECPQAQYTGIAMEYGTAPMMEVIDALRADHWLQLHPEATAALRQSIKQNIRDAFYCDADDWKLMVIAQSRAALQQAIKGLGRS